MAFNTWFPVKTFNIIQRHLNNIKTTKKMRDKSAQLSKKSEKKSTNYNIRL